MSLFLPPDMGALARRLVSVNAGRARRVSSRLHPLNDWHRDALAAFDATLAHRRGRGADWLLDPGVRAWLSAAEEAIGLSETGLDEVTLFERVAAGAHLAEAAPSGRVDRRFRLRVARIARRLTRRQFDRLIELLIFRTPPRTRFGPYPLELDADADEARLAGELHLSHPAALSLRVTRGTRILLTSGGVLFKGGTRGPVVTARACIPGTSIVLARRLVPARDGRRPGRPVPGLGGRLARALELLRAAWDEAHREVITCTRIVVPLFEPATVSFSQPDRPGVSYIRIPGKSVLQLADDLLHETAHHRLHALEETGPLSRDDGEPRYYSPWRRTLRPLRGILHATYTFSYRAQLLARLARMGGPLPRAWIRRELAFETAALTASLSDLADARSLGLLTPEGVRLLRAMREASPWRIPE